ncbi:hypothetical protein NNC19_05225 [Clostridium sp. SHJSY1]|uniref:hypothetical protein n=1 Tax=Clostridium sp. SHJSY1 TaxID=2942483 RepID=UPI00287687AD|nr:hypothetical protein [Clostridium sp. SHJSY1]MDS0525075.1 hypothetical protein [Clostridium sp. SHJSY1]
MNYVTAFNNYVVVNPIGEMQGFAELDEAVSAVDSYDLENILKLSEKPKKNSMFDMYQEQDMKDAGVIFGVDEGECQIYNMDNLITSIRNSDIFEDEKNELISELLKEKINLNVYDRGIVQLLSNVEVEWT